MPNHITNILTIEGDEEQIKKCLVEIKGKEEDQFIDFNTFIPIPKELDGTSSPTQIISQKEYDEQEARIAKGELTEIEKQWGVTRGITKEMSKKYIEEFGADNWYNWQVSNWGTKWNAYSQSHSEGDNVITFDTAWSTPYNAMAHLSAKYPELKFSVKYADEDFGYNVGEYTLQSGECLEQYLPEGGSVEAIRMAMEITGDVDYYFHDYLVELEEDDVNNFATSIIELAHEEQYLVEEYPIFVLERLKEYAIADEQYERVAEIEGIIKLKHEEKI